MNDYTYKDVMRMQSEAKQRVLEMQKRSRLVADNYNSGNKKTEVVNCKEDDENDNENNLPRVVKAISYPTEITTGRNKRINEKDKNIASGLRNSLRNIFGNITEGDTEKLFIMSLCLLLAEESTDDTLIIALMYLLT